MNEAQQCHHNEFNINPYGAMQLMVENGCELEGLGPSHRPGPERFRWCKVAGTFQIKVPDGWDLIGVAMILRRKFRMIERKPRVWQCNKFPAIGMYAAIPGKKVGFDVAIECEDPPQYVSYVITEVL